MDVSSFDHERIDPGRIPGRDPDRTGRSEDAIGSRHRDCVGRDRHAMTLPINIKVNVLPRFPAQVIGRTAITVTKASGIYNFDIDYSKMLPVTSLPAAPLYTLVWNSDTNQYILSSLGAFTYTEAPNDTFTYGRHALTWVKVLPLSGGTMTGPLILSSGATALGDAPSDGNLYGRKNAAWNVVSGFISDAPSDGTIYGRQNAAWVAANPGGVGVVPENSQSANYTTVAGDAGKFIYHPASDANARTFTIAANGSVPYALGTVISFANLSANALTIAIASDTMYLAGPGTTGSRTLAQYGCCTALKTDTTAWIISGTGLT